jgi:hypothetical protein
MIGTSSAGVPVPLPFGISLAPTPAPTNSGIPSSYAENCSSHVRFT